MQISKEKRTLRLVKPLAAAKKEDVVIPVSLRVADVKPSAAPNKKAVATAHREPTAGVTDYYKRIERYAQQIRQTDNIAGIIDILDVALLETRALHSDDEMRAAREQVRRAEQKIELLKNELEQLKELVHADPLTGALNRSGLDHAYTREAARADRHDTPLCVALLDLDDFKRFNDTSGHVAGDSALRHLVNVAKETLRPSDIIARFGGEEFVVLMPDTGIDSAMLVIFRLQRGLAERRFMYAGQALPITFSAGVTPRTLYERESTVLSRADKALYEAKHAGKNRVLAAPW